MAKYINFDDYILQSEPFAKPLLEYFRACVQVACPDAEETFKWGMPMFVYKKSILCHMATFKKHTSYGFWLAAKMKDPENVFIGEANSGMGQFGKVTSMEQLPSEEVLIKYIQEAMELTDAGEKLSNTPKKEPKRLKMPNAMMDALNENVIAKSTFENFSQSNKNDYIEWIADAKTDTTRTRRIVQMMEWLEEGKPRNWKYMKKYKT
ncbi:MAG: hypothetical protein Crog4KO_12050 [Crocinitomicaceae bacterium]